jgi:hypothetical protein
MVGDCVGDEHHGRCVEVLPGWGEDRDNVGHQQATSRGSGHDDP